MKAKQKLFFLFTFIFLIISNLQAQTAQQYYQQANQYREDAEYQKAIELYTKAIREKSIFADAYAGRAYAYSRLDLHQKALDDYNEALMQGGVQYEYLVYYNRGWAKYNLGQKAEACPDWQKALDLGYEKAKETLKKYCKY